MTGNSPSENQVSRMCTCAMHCVESPYHESACCQKSRCDCWCHDAKRRRDALREEIGIAQDSRKVAWGKFDGS